MDIGTFASAFAGKRNILIGGYWSSVFLMESKQVNKVYWLDEQLVAVGFGFRDGENVISPN